VTRRDVLALFAIGAGGSRAVRAQKSTFFFRVDLVHLNVVVRGSSGVVRDLAIEDFILDESGRPQSIREFSRGTDSPLTVALLLHTSGNQIRLVERERQASELFRERASGAPRVIGPLQGTKLYDLIVLACNDQLSWQSGRKACVLVSDGIDDGSESSLKEAVEAAQRADALVYSVLFYDALARDSHRADRGTALKRISLETGGRYFEVAGLQTVERIYKEIDEELGSIYGIGFAPEVAGPGYRAIRVGVKRSGLVARTREVYYAQALTHGLRIVSVDPQAARTGALVTASGNGLDRSSIASLFLTDGARTVATEVVEQSDTEIRFRVPEQTEAGPWRVGETRPHRWTIVLQTAEGDLLQYVGFKIGIE
jgi:Ca-activated chloride channel family protein